MHVRALQLHNLFSHDETKLLLPDTGLVLVTGPNGAGKSALTECVSVAGWGKTLRGTPAWRTGCSSVAFMETTNLMVKRTRNGKKSPELEWFDPDGDDDYDFTTTTKAQHALEAKIGSWDVWRRSHVFSSSDAAHFTLATDAERKRLLEAVLGLDRFDAALKACRADLKVEQTKCVEKRHELEKYRTMLTGHEQRVEDQNAALKTLGKKPTAQLDLVDAAAIKDVEHAIAGTKADIADQRGMLDDDRTLVVEAGAAGRAARDRIRHLADGDTCPTCGQALSEKHHDALRTIAEKADAHAAALHKKLDSAMLDQRTVVEELEEELDLLQRKRVTLIQKRERGTAAQDQVKRWEEQKKHHDLKLAQAKLCVGALKQDIKRAEGELARLVVQYDTLSACEKVLGLKGVRAHVLGKALGGLEAVANDWLVRLRRPDLQLCLRPYSTTAKGDVNDAIGLEVEGAGGGYGYKATSGGERRRIDVALVFSLATVAGAAHGRDEGTLFMDETFDCLDEDGQDAVAEALRELSQDRCVVVITHNKELAQLLPASQHLRVEAGTVSKVA